MLVGHPHRPDLANAQWHLFCRVIDNYGDAGVTWRLATQLAHQGLSVIIWIDQPQVLVKLSGNILLTTEQNPLKTLISIRQWVDEPNHQKPPANSPLPQLPYPVDQLQIFVALFSCELPEECLQHLRSYPRSAIWINLEYLSAESWVEEYHGVSGVAPQWGVPYYYFFPGYTPNTGGLLRQHPQDSPLYPPPPSAQQEWLAKWGYRETIREEEQWISLFYYPNISKTNLAYLFDAWATGILPIRCLVPVGECADTAFSIMQNNIKGMARNDEHTHPVPAGTTLQQGQLLLHTLPWIPQHEYDLLLQVCDWNMVRGEDSWVTAQWSKHPLIWQAYPQTDNTHHIKLQAFAQRYHEGLPTLVGQALHTIWCRWNGMPDAGSDSPADWRTLWQTLQRHNAELQAHALNWANRQSEQADLVTQLQLFVINKFSV